MPKSALAVFLNMFAPNPLCIECLSRLVGSDETEIQRGLADLEPTGRIEAATATCGNCDRARHTVRSRK